MKSVLFILLGFIIGSIVTVFAMTHLVSGRMVEVYQSNQSLDETVLTIETKATEAGWKIPKIYDMQKSLADAGYTTNPVKVISMCLPQSASRLLGDDNTRNISAFMPCRISVFETEDGRVWMARMNGTMAGRIFGGDVADVMAMVTKQQDDILKDLIHQSESN